MPKFILISLVGFLLISCSETPKQKHERERFTNVKSETPYGWGCLVTVEHDKHLFIIEERYSKGAMIHHPDCPCRKIIND